LQGASLFLYSFFVQRIGIDLNDARDIIRMTAVNSHIPEPIRIAHIIAGGLTRGESRGRA